MPRNLSLSRALRATTVVVVAVSMLALAPVGSARPTKKPHAVNHHNASWILAHRLWPEFAGVWSSNPRGRAREASARHVTAPDGSGSVAASQTSVTAGSTGLTLRFTYTAAGKGIVNGAVAIAVPASWSPPSTSGADDGFTTASAGNVAVSGQTISVSGLTLSGGGTFSISYGGRSGGGGGASAPQGATAQTWATSERSSASGTLKALASSPSVAVTPPPAPAPPSPQPPSPPPPASFPYSDRVGFTSHTDFLSPTDGLAYLQRASALGVHWFREDFAWSVLEPQRGQFNWTVTDALMRNMSAVGGNVLAMAGYSPSWASGHTGSDKYPPTNPQDYADFVTAVANRYGTGGTFWQQNPTLTPQPLRAIELWNEPWSANFWGPDPDPAAYAALVRAAAPAIKAVHPEISVLISGDLHFDYADHRANSWLNGWLSVLLKQDLPMASVDGWSIHPYCGNRGPYQTTIPGFADQTYAQQWLYQQLPLIRDMTTNAGKFKPLWSTEFGWSTTGDVDSATQAQFTTGAVKRAVDEWGSFVVRSFFYVLERPHNGDYAGGYNLLNDDLTPKPAWTALQSLLATS